MDLILELISFLTEKNCYLEKFYSVNESEYAKFVSGDFDSIEQFYDLREYLLKRIQFVDSKIEEIQKKINNGIDVSISERSEIIKVLATKDAFIKRIIEQDLKIMVLLDEAKSAVFKELQDIRKSKKISGYKSKSFHRQLDEEA